MSDLVQRLNGACNGWPHAKIPWPHYLLHEAAARIKELEAEAHLKATRITQLEAENKRLREALDSAPRPESLLSDKAWIVVYADWFFKTQRAALRPTASQEGEG